MDNKPNLRSVVERYTVLSQHGQELLGHCPLHDDCHPSLRVNPDKGVWFCPPCNIGGDVFTFLEKVEGLTFQQALEYLCVDDRPGPSRAEILKRKRLKDASQNLTTWASTVSELVADRMRTLASQIQMARQVIRELESADKPFLTNEIAKWQREWAILEVLDDDLAEPDLLLDFWRERELIEHLVTRI